MPEYIEREAAIHELEHDAPEQVGYSREDAVDCIRYMDAADVALVVHGRWIPVPSSDMATGPAYKCSNCQKMRYGAFLPPFCPNCGAKMDLEET